MNLREMGIPQESHAGRKIIGHSKRRICFPEQDFIIVLITYPTTLQSDSEAQTMMVQ